MADWYDKAQKELVEEAVASTSLTEEQFIEAYSFLNEIGLIDYDVEKEVLYERYEED